MADRLRGLGPPSFHEHSKVCDREAHEGAGHCRPQNRRHGKHEEDNKDEIDGKADRSDPLHMQTPHCTERGVVSNDKPSAIAMVARNWLGEPEVEVDYELAPSSRGSSRRRHD